MPAPPRIAGMAVVFGTLIATGGTAWSHDPLEATTTIEVGGDWIELRSIFGSRRAFTACGSSRFEVCAHDLYQLSVNGVALPTTSVQATLRPDGDLELVTRHRRPATGPLRIAALHVQRNPSEMTGTYLAVVDGDRPLRHQVLDGDCPFLDLPLPGRNSGARRGFAALLAIGLAASALLLRRRRARRTKKAFFPKDARGAHIHHVG